MGQAAADYLTANPLHISQEDADAISALAHTRIFSEVASAYNNASSLNFYALPSGVQTAIADAAYQYGLPKLIAKAPNFWGDVTRGDWSAAIAELDKFNDKYTTRRHDEEKLVQDAVNAGLRDGFSC